MSASLALVALGAAATAAKAVQDFTQWRSEFLAAHRDLAPATCDPNLEAPFTDPPPAWTPAPVPQMPAACAVGHIHPVAVPGPPSRLGHHLCFRPRFPW